MNKYYIIILFFLYSMLSNYSSNGQTIFSRTVEEEDCTKTISIFTNIDTLGIKQFDCKIFGLIINKESAKYYAIAYILRAPRFLFINKSYRLKLFFESGEILEFENINDPDYFDAGTEIEFRTITEEAELKKMESSGLCFLRLERPGSYFDIKIEPNYQYKLSNLAKFMIVNTAF